MYVLQIVVCPFVFFLSAIVFSVLLRYTDSVSPFGIFKLFLQRQDSERSCICLLGVSIQRLLSGATLHLSLNDDHRIKC
jgi:hypothetical protein